ncbi:terpene synthase family protein [Streptomyces sp. NPDC055239]
MNDTTTASAQAITLPGPHVYQGPLQSWPFDLPFVPRSTPARERARVTAHSRAWAQRMGLTPQPAHHAKIARYDMPLYVCLNYPDATGSDLDLVSDWVTWWALWNDLTDEPAFLATPGRAARLFQSLVAVVTPHHTISTPPAPSDIPFVNAFTDLWARWQQDMSTTFITRTANNWTGWFKAYITECANRRTRTAPDTGSYLRHRDLTGAVPLIMDAVERTGHYEVRAYILNSTPLQAMRHSTTRVINITQDVQSLSKEESVGDPHNLVLVLERQQGLSRHQALAHIHAMTRSYTDAFLDHEASIPHLLDTLDIPVEDRPLVYRHTADLCTLMKGSADFCTRSGRYSTPPGDLVGE